MRHAGVVGTLLLAVFGLAAIGGCATETHQVVPIELPASAATPYAGPKQSLVVSNFDNRSSYLRGMFSDGVDRLGSQAKTILMADLQSTGRFVVLDRDNLETLAQEAKLKGVSQTLQGADIAITGDVVEFGRKEVGDRALFGILGTGKTQVAYSKVTLNVVNVLTSEVVYSASGAGEYALSYREVLGTGGTAGYDPSLNGKVLDLAIRQAIDQLVIALEQGKWHVAA